MADPRAIKEFISLAEENLNKGIRPIRLFCIGHKLIYGYTYSSWVNKWECLSCANQWVSEDGEVCPKCGVFYEDC